MYRYQLHQAARRSPCFDISFRFTIRHHQHYALYLSPSSNVLSFLPQFHQRQLSYASHVYIRPCTTITSCIRRLCQCMVQRGRATAAPALWTIGWFFQRSALSSMVDTRVLRVGVVRPPASRRGSLLVARWVRLPTRSTRVQEILLANAVSTYHTYSSYYRVGGPTTLRGARPLLACVRQAGGTARVATQREGEAERADALDSMRPSAGAFRARRALNSRFCARLAPMRQFLAAYFDVVVQAVMRFHRTPPSPRL